MKKIIAILTGLVLLSSIILVTFFGTLPFTKEKNVYCDYIVLNMRNIMNADNVVVEVLERPAESKIKGGDEWFDNDYSYRINVHDNKFLLEQLNGTFQMHCEAKTLRIGKLVSDPKLKYSISEVNWENYLIKNELEKDYIKLKKDVFISEAKNKYIPFTIKVQSNDIKGRFMKIRMQIGPYEKINEGI